MSAYVCKLYADARWGVLVPVALLLLCFTVSVSAYAIYQATRPVYQPHITPSTPASVMQPGGATAAEAGLDITVTGSAADKDMLYVGITVKTKDGSPISQSGATQYTGPFQGFRKITLSVDGQEFVIGSENPMEPGGMIMRHDDGTQPDTAQFEAMFWGDFSDMKGKEATLVLDDFTQRLETCEEAGFLFENLGEAYTQLTPESPENFIETGVYMEYADGSTASSYTIPAGPAHIEFSDQFPGAYIDNMGFHKTGEQGSEVDMLYISIVPVDARQKAELESLGFQALDTRAPLEPAGYLGNGPDSGVIEPGYDDLLAQDHAAKLAHNGQRVVLVLEAPWPDHRDLTQEDLANFRLVKNIGWDDQNVRAGGSWELPLTVSAGEAIVYTPNKTLQLANGGSMTVQQISISPLKLQMSGIEDGMNSKTPFSSPATVVLADGTSFVADHKGASGGWGQGSFDFEWHLDQLVDPQQVVAIEIDGQRIELAQ